jgi:hypothetical protein
MTRKPNGDYILCFQSLYTDEYGRVSTSSCSRLEVWDPTLGYKYTASDKIIEKYLVDTEGAKKAVKGARNWLVDIIPWFGHSLHQIKYDHGGLYLVDCGRNHLIFIHDDGQLTPRMGAYYKYAEILFNGTAYDLNHPNSIVTSSHGVVAVLLHNRGNWLSEIAFAHNNGNGLTYSNERLQLQHYGAHDIYFTEDDCVIYNASEQNSVIKMDVASREIVKEVDLGDTYPKGMLVIEDHIIVGVTENSDFFQRFVANSDLVILDMDLEVVSGWKLGKVGGINDIMSIGE